MFAFDFLSSVLSTPLIHQIRNGHMQVELCEIPLPGRPEVLRNEATMDVRCTEAPRPQGGASG